MKQSELRKYIREEILNEIAKDKITCSMNSEVGKVLKKNVSRLKMGTYSCHDLRVDGIGIDFDDQFTSTQVNDLLSKLNALSQVKSAKSTKSKAIIIYPEIKEKK